jgi:hypothetical protein
MVYYGKGFSWTELYDMPVWLRNFYYKKIIEAKEKEKKDRDTASKNTKASKPRILKPMIGSKK